MKRAIWKFTLPLEGETIDAVVSMPRGAQVLSVHAEGPQLWVWALVDPDEKDQPRRIIGRSTGLEFDHDPLQRFVGTVVRDQKLKAGAVGLLVWHIFETPVPRPKLLNLPPDVLKELEKLGGIQATPVLDADEVAAARAHKGKPS